MAQVQLLVGGRSYQIGCRDGEEARLRQLGRIVDARVADVVGAIGAIGRGDPGRELLMTALLLADDLDEARETVAELTTEEASRAAAVARCAERIEALVAKLENGGQSA